MLPIKNNKWNVTNYEKVKEVFKECEIIDKQDIFNPFHATGLFRYPQKTENQRFSDVFRGYQKRPVA